jgi:hypothetical protein
VSYAQYFGAPGSCKLITIVFEDYLQHLERTREWVISHTDEEREDRE